MKTLARMQILGLCVVLFIPVSTAQYAKVAGGSKIMISAQPWGNKPRVMKILGTSGIPGSCGNVSGLDFSSCLSPF